MGEYRMEVLERMERVRGTVGILRGAIRNARHEYDATAGCCGCFTHSLFLSDIEDMIERLYQGDVCELLATLNDAVVQPVTCPTITATA